MESLPILTQSDEEDFEDGPKEHEAAQAKKGLLGPKKEADYDFFVDVMWPKISTKEEKQRMTPNLVYQVPQHCLPLPAAMSTSAVSDCDSNSLLLLQACELAFVFLDGFYVIQQVTQVVFNTMVVSLCRRSAHS